LGKSKLIQKKDGRLYFSTFGEESVDL